MRDASIALSRLHRVAALAAVAVCLPWLASCATMASPVHSFSAARIPPGTGGAPPTLCAAPEGIRWALDGKSDRVLLVWLDAAGASLDQWTVFGRLRLRAALDRWNAMRLPVRFALASARGAADVRIDVISRFPFDRSDPNNATRAGVTHLAYSDHGEIVRAQILMAESTPRGARYTAADQEAILMHELGHALGLPHSPNRFSIMASRPVVSSVTDADLTAVRLLYAGRGCAARQTAANARLAPERLRP